MMMDIVAQEAIFYITAGLCTFLAIVVSYRWLVKQPEKKEEGKEEGKEEAERKEADQKKMKEATEEDKVPQGCPFGFELMLSDDKKQPHITKSQDSIGDLLIDSSDIQPLNDDEKKKLEEDGASVRSEEAEMLDHKKVKELEEELVKSMTQQQLDEEAKARQAQLEAIFNLMEDNTERFGMSSVDDVQNQYKLYV